jgi:2'-5' RNA ligase
VIPRFGPDKPRRLFIALTLPEAIRGQIAALEEPIPGFSWIAAERLHLTMRFLGEVGIEKAEALTERLGRVRVEPFILPIEGTGVFPQRGPARVAWAGTGRGHPRLFQLRQKIDDAVLSTGLDVEMRSFAAHITVARVQEGASDAAREWALRRRAFVAAAMRVDGFTLYHSELTAAGPAYHAVTRFVLAGGQGGR